MKQYFNFSMNAILRGNYGTDQIYFSTVVFIFHSFYQTAFFGFFYFSNLILENRILLLFKIYLYNPRTQEKVTIRRLISIITKVKERKKMLETMIKRCCKTLEMVKKRQNIGNMLLFLKKHVSLNNDPNGWGWSFVFCIFAYIKYDICCFFFFLFI